MAKERVVVSTQYYENYGHHEGNFHWKAKGEHKFVITMDSDLLMYTDSVSILTKMVEEQSNDLEKFEYRDHTVEWGTPTVLGSQDDYIMMNQKLNPED